VTFHDRLGDTYKAKGHNISTAEVEMAFLSNPHISSANVYSISMTKYGYDGQIGCAAITFRESAPPDRATTIELDTIKELEKWLVSEAGLPAYGVPRFLRVLVDEDKENAAERDIGISEDVGNERVSLMMKKLKTGLRKEGLCSLLSLFFRALRTFMLMCCHMQALCCLRPARIGYIGQREKVQDSLNCIPRLFPGCKTVKRVSKEVGDSAVERLLCVVGQND
jgi:hypothetical protein